MSVSIPEFWNLMLASRMASPNSLPTLQAKFSQLKGADEEGNVATLAQWLIAQGALSRYQAKVLMAGQPGPFVYGDYRVYDRLGSGRLQGAFRVLHPATRHRVLLWFHSGPMVSNTQWWAIAVEQIALAAQIVHPQVARIYQLCDLGQFKFTALEDLQGDSVLARLATGPIPPAVACRMVRQAALGVSRMHEFKQLHGSIRPQNLWIDEEENVKLLLPPVARDPRIVLGPIDFSAAHPGEEVLRQADYLAPEMAQTGYLPNTTTDVYALGCTLFHLLAGKPPFAGRDALSKLASHGSEKIPSLESVGVPGPVSQVLAGMMAKDPTRRYQKPRQVADALAQVLEKLDPRQLHWPTSPISNKLPEYEAWLQPYKLAPESKTNWIPEIETPPILAASMRAEEPRPALEYFPELAPPTLPAATAPNLIEPAGGIDIAGAFLPPARPAAPAQGPGMAPARPAPPAVAPGTTPARAISPSSPAVRAVTAPPQIGFPGHASPNMQFPPDEIDAIIPFASTDMKRQNHGQRRMLFSGAVVAAFMLILLFLWLSTNKKPTEPASPGTTNETGGANATAGGAATVDSKTTETKPEGNHPDEKNPDAKLPDDAVSPDVKTERDTKEAAPPPKSSSTDRAKHHNAAIVANETAKKSATGNRTNLIHKSKFKLVADAVVPPESQTVGSQTASTTPNATSDYARSLWASPTNGTPVSLAYLASGVQAVLVLRPADLLRQPDGQKALVALGPVGVAILKNIQSLSGMRLAEIEQLTIGWIDQMDAGTEPEILPMYVVRYSKPMTIEKLLSSWGVSSSVKSYDWAIYQAPQGLTAVMPPPEQGQVLLLGPSEAIQDAIKLAGQPPPLPRPLEKLLRATDNGRQATLLWVSNVTAPSSGELSWPDNSWQMLLSDVRRFLGAETRAAALSAHLSDGNFFLELRVEGPLGRAPELVARQFKERLAHLPGNVNNYIKGLNLDAYDKSLLFRFPQMIKLLDEYTRTGSDQDQALLRCYLPAAAAQNLIMGTELALAEATIATAGNTPEVAGQNGQPQTVAQKLKRVTTLSFARDTLEKSIQMLADDLGIKAQIIGPDLQLEGITKNQSFGLDEKDKPADDILRIIMLKANPDGKLVYVIKPDPSGGEEMLFITTRAAAAKRGDALPAELEQPAAKK